MIWCFSDPKEPRSRANPLQQAQRCQTARVTQSWMRPRNHFWVGRGHMEEKHMKNWGEKRRHSLNFVHKAAFLTEQGGTPRRRIGTRPTTVNTPGMSEQQDIGAPLGEIPRAQNPRAKCFPLLQGKNRPPSLLTNKRSYALNSVKIEAKITSSILAESEEGAGLAPHTLCRQAPASLRAPQQGIPHSCLPPGHQGRRTAVPARESIITFLQQTRSLTDKTFHQQARFFYYSHPPF